MNKYKFKKRGRKGTVGAGEGHERVVLDACCGHQSNRDRRGGRKAHPIALQRSREAHGRGGRRGSGGVKRRRIARALKAGLVPASSYGEEPLDFEERVALHPRQAAHRRQRTAQRRARSQSRHRRPTLNSNSCASALSVAFSPGAEMIGICVLRNISKQSQNSKYKTDKRQLYLTTLIEQDGRDRASRSS